MDISANVLLCFISHRVPRRPLTSSFFLSEWSFLHNWCSTEVLQRFQRGIHRTKLFGEDGDFIGLCNDVLTDWRTLL